MAVYTERSGFWQAGIHRNNISWYQGIHSGFSAAVTEYQIQAFSFSLCTGEGDMFFSFWSSKACCVCQPGYWSVCFLSNFCGAVRRAAIAGMCYLNSLLQTDNRFAAETSGRLKAALSETGSERDSASQCLSPLFPCCCVPDTRQKKSRQSESVLKVRISEEKVIGTVPVKGIRSVHAHIVKWAAPLSPCG